MAGLIDSFFTKNKVAFLTFLTFGCVCGAVFRYDMEWWDFVNYHYYNAWAFLNDRLNVDVVPAFINTFFSPFIELPAYYLINALQERPVIFSAVMSVPYGLLLFAAYKISTLFFPPDTKQGRTLIGLTLLLSICSVAVFMELSGTTHEHSMSFLSLTALYFLLKKMPSRVLDVKTCLISGFLLGIAAGLKMTYCLYAAATGITLILFARSFDRPVKSIALFTLAGTVGFLTAYGYWGWILWKNFENPFFPFLNGIFQSPYWDAPEYKDVRYFNLPWLNVILYPLHQFLHIGGDFSMHHRFLVSHLRLVVGMLVFAAAFGRIVTDRRSVKEKNPAEFLIRFIMVWMTAVYVLWLYFFRVYRYMIPFDLMLSIVLVYFFFRSPFSFLKRVPYTARIILFLVFSVAAGYECTHLLYSRWFDRPLLPANIRPLPDDTLVLVEYFPSSLFIPFLAPNSTVRVVLSPELDGYNVNGSRMHSSGYFARKRNKLIDEHIKHGKPIARLVGRPFYTYSEGLHEKCDRIGVLAGIDYYVRYFLCAVRK